MKIDDISGSNSARNLTANLGEHDPLNSTSWCPGHENRGYKFDQLRSAPNLTADLGEHDLSDSTRSLPMSLQTTLLNSITLTSQKTLPAAGEDRSPPPQNETKMIQRLSPKRREEGISGREILDRIAKGRTIEESKILGDSESDKDMGRHSEAEGNEILKRRIDGEMGLVKKEKGG